MPKNQQLDAIHANKDTIIFQKEAVSDMRKTPLSLLVLYLFPYTPLLSFEQLALQKSIDHQVGNNLML